jgi:hypothetical protein
MDLVCHGGHCCGIKHIYDLGVSPNSIRYGRPGVEYTTDPFWFSNGAGDTSPGKRFYLPALNKEKAWRRLDRYLKYLDERRPKGIVEVVVISAGPNCPTPYFPYYQQHKNWRRTLLKRGFKKVNECENSNSGAILHVYHRNSGEVSVNTKKEKKDGNSVERQQQILPPAVVSPFD